MRAGAGSRRGGHCAFPHPRSALKDASIAVFNHSIVHGLSAILLAVSQKYRVALILQVEKAALVKTALVWKVFIPAQLCLLFFQDATHAYSSTRHTRRFWIGWPKPVRELEKK